MPDAATIDPATDWRGFVTDDLKADPVVTGFVEKASEKDIPSLIKGYAHATKRLGSAINLPGKDAKPEDVNAIRERLYEAGVFTKPPGKPEDYAIVKPEKLPDGLLWNDELAKDFAMTLHKHGASKGLGQDLAALYEKAIMGAQKTLKTSYDDGMKALRDEHKENFDSRMEMVKRMTPAIFKTEEEVKLFEELGLGDHPGFLSIMLRLAPLAMQDSSFVEQVKIGGGAQAAETVRQEHADIMNNKENPRHAGYLRGEPAVIAYIEDLYRKAYGTAPATTGIGLTSERKE